MPKLGNKQYSYDAKGKAQYEKDKQKGYKEQLKSAAKIGGNESSNVEKYQTMLSKPPYEFYDGEIDGIWGPKTAKADSMFQALSPKVPAQSEGMRGSGWGGKMGKRVEDWLMDKWSGFKKSKAKPGIGIGIPREAFKGRDKISS